MTDVEVLASKQISLEYAEEILKKVLEKTEQLNNSSNYCYKIAEIRILGEYLAEQDPLSRIEISFELKPVNECEQGQMELEELRIAQVRESGKVFENFFEEVNWPKFELQKAIEEVSEYISVRILNMFERVSVPNRIIYLLNEKKNVRLTESQIAFELNYDEKFENFYQLFESVRYKWLLHMYYNLGINRLFEKRICLNSTILLLDLIYEAFNNDFGDSEWFTFKREALRQETGLSRNDFAQARENLIKLGLVAERAQGNPRGCYFKINYNAVFEILNSYKSE